MDSNFIRVTPFLQVPDLEAAVGFFVDVLGFSRWPLPWHDYAYVHRETVGLRLMQGPDGAAPRGSGRYAYYIDVRDVDALYAELKPRLDALPEGGVHAPVDQFYGQRELAVLAPDGDLIVFGQAIHDMTVRE